MKKQFTIPVFVPHSACPNLCVFCDQHKITGNAVMPSVNDIHNIVERNLSTMPANAHVEIGFFGGTFTGMPADSQAGYLAAVQPYIDSGRISGLRLSTRPDYIDTAALGLLKKFHVSLIELGAQCMSNNVLSLAKRGHTAADVSRAATLIKQAGFGLGLQMMIGLPGDSAADDMLTAESFAALGADCVRIYPVLVIKGTALEQLFVEKKYTPLTLDEAAERTSVLLEYFDTQNIPVIRAGLHLSEEMREGQEIVAGPVHPSFREIAMTKAWARKFRDLTQGDNKCITISVNKHQYNAAIGYGAANKKWLQQKNGSVSFRVDNNLNGMEFHVDHC